MQIIKRKTPTCFQSITSYPFTHFTQNSKIAKMEFDETLIIITFDTHFIDDLTGVIQPSIHSNYLRNKSRTLSIKKTLWNGLFRCWCVALWRHDNNEQITVHKFVLHMYVWLYYMFALFEPSKNNKLRKWQNYVRVCVRVCRYFIIGQYLGSRVEWVKTCHYLKR